MSNKKVKSQKSSKRSGAVKGNTDRRGIVAELFKSSPSTKYSLKNLAAASGGADREGRFAVKEIVEKMIENGTVDKLASDKYRLSLSHMPTFEGEVDMTASGSLYVKVEGLEKDIFVHSKNTGHALHGDIVKVALISRHGSSPEGQVVSIVRRSNRNFVGVVEMGKGYAFVRVDSRKVPEDIYVPVKNDERKIENGQKVVVRVTSWNEDEKSPRGEIVEVLGMAGDNDTEMHAILAEFDLPYKFEEDVEKEAEAISGEITDRDYAERRDMRDTVTFTIDPEDAKDFDDALSIRKKSEGVWEVGVHIADVTHYVRLDTMVENEARDRATSVYLVDRTIPMLPERLSNDLCSLRPNEEKLTFSAVFDMDGEGNVLDQWLGRTVIYSDRRFTYAEAQNIIKTGEGDFKEEVLTLNSIARKLRAARFRNGAISFEREEAKFDLDENGKPLGVYFKEAKESNQLIEEFMLLANRKVAEFVGKKRGVGANAERTFVYRVHDKPNADKLMSFRSFITRFGYNFKADRSSEVPKEMNRLLAEIKGKSEENLISTLAIRTMAKAYYTTDNIGHYGLAFDYYSHFTSPIRRYPDMMVHRLLANYLHGGKSPDKEYYEQLCEHSSEMEVRATDAERSSIKYKMVEFMLDKVGMEFDGHISGITEWGIYVELNETHIEGMVALRDMTDDFYVFNEDDYAVKGHSSGRTFTLGDEVRIKILRADLARKQLDFQMTASYDFKTHEAIPVVERTNANVAPQERQAPKGGARRRKR